MSYLSLTKMQWLGEWSHLFLYSHSDRGVVKWRVDIIKGEVKIRSAVHTWIH